MEIHFLSNFQVRDEKDQSRRNTGARQRSPLQAAEQLFEIVSDFEENVEIKLAGS